jgi:hypothetical protein
MANKAGGAHVDPEIKSRCVALTRLNSLEWGYGPSYVTVDPGPNDQPMGNPVPANVRQIAYEVETAITEQLGHLLGQGNAA